MDAIDRERVDLGGDWAYEPVARTEFREGGELGADPEDVPPAGRMPVPSTWYDHIGNFHGRVRFTRDLPAVDGDGWWLTFDGVDYLADVVVDGTHLVHHEGAFDPFAVALPAGSRRLEVLVDAPREEPGTLWPHRKRQFKGILTQWEPLEAFQATTGGIWGGVQLERRPDPHVAHLATTTTLVPRPQVGPGGYVSEDGIRDARVLIEVEVRSSREAAVPVTATLCGRSVERTLALAAGVSKHRLVMTVPDPVLWWPWDVGDPVLHDLVVSLPGDAVRQRVGLREVQFDEPTGRFTVNGVDVPVRGSSLIPDKWLARYSPQRARADMALVRGANLNLVRVCAHVANDHLYDAMDEAGVLAWQDLPLQWDYLISDDMVREASDQVERIVRHLQNHASIALWTCQNEPFPAVQGNFSAALVRAVHQADGSRSVHPASAFSEHVYPGWFAGHLRDYTRPSEVPIVSEFGALAFPSADEVRAMGGSAWPPAGEAWDALLSEPTPLLDIAGVPLGADLEELVLASQRYQARAVQVAVESYRLQGRNFIHFLLTSGWPTVDWSVVSYDRVPKLAYETLARACQPVLIGTTLQRDIVSDAWDAFRFPPLADGIWVRNDTAEAFEAARFVATLGGQTIAEGTLDVPARDLARWHAPSDGWPTWSPPDLAPGEWVLELVLTDRDGQVRSRNAYPFRVVAHGLALRPPG